MYARSFCVVCCALFVRAADAKWITFEGPGQVVGPTMSIVDGKLTNIGSDGLTHVLEFHSGYFGFRPSWPECDYPYPIYELLLGTETPDQVVTVSTWGSECVGDPDRDPLLDRHFTAGPGKLGGLGTGFQLTPPLRLDGSYQVISIDNVLVPEPSSLILAVTALMLFASRRRRQPRRSL